MISYNDSDSMKRMFPSFDGALALQNGSGVRFLISLIFAHDFLRRLGTDLVFMAIGIEPLMFSRLSTDGNLFFIQRQLFLTLILVVVFISLQVSTSQSFIKDASD